MIRTYYKRVRACGGTMNTTASQRTMERMMERMIVRVGRAEKQCGPVNSAGNNVTVKCVKAQQKTMRTQNVHTVNGCSAWARHQMGERMCV